LPCFGGKAAASTRISKVPPPAAPVRLMRHASTVGASGCIRAYEMRVWAETWNRIAFALPMFGDPSLTFCGGRAAQASLGCSFEGIPIFALQGSINIELRSREDVCHSPRQKHDARSLRSALVIRHHFLSLGQKEIHNTRGRCAV
jgi:hypothetical protein